MPQASAPGVTIYTRPFCGYCARAVALLKHKGVNFVEVDIGAHPERRAEMVGRAGGRNTFPQIFIGDRHIGGCDDLYDLEAKGGLDPLLEGA
ncbi:MAG: glutaredoxin 3 [Caulobacterales bacterium]